MNYVAEGLASGIEMSQSDIYHYRIVEQRWITACDNPNDQTLIVVHGYWDHAALYGPMIRWALKQGYHVHVFDLPGHGLSGGPLAEIESFDDYSGVLATILQRENYKYYALSGLSTGGAVIVNALLNPRFKLLSALQKGQLVFPLK